MKIKLFAAFITLFIMSYVLFNSFLHQHESIKLPFKCVYSTEYVFQHDMKEFRINVTHDLRLYDDSTGYFIFNGDAVIDNVSYQARCSVSLKNIREKQGKTFQATIVKQFQ